MELRLYLFLLVQIMLLLRIVTLGSAQFFFKLKRNTALKG